MWIPYIRFPIHRDSLQRDSLYKDPRKDRGRGKDIGKGMYKGGFVHLFVQKGNVKQDSYAKLHTIL